MKKVCVVVASRANYGRIKYLMKAIQDSDDLELQIIVGASLLIERFGMAVNILISDGFTPDKSIFYNIEGENLLTQAKSTGLGIIELSTAFGDLKPDFVVTVADRYETMATAIAASYMNIALIHVQGGEVSGNIDDRVRHAITKLADFHFVCTEKSKERVIKMGEREENVFNYGCPAMDVVHNSDLTISNNVMSKYGGVGSSIDWTKPYIFMIQHPVTTSYGDGFDQVRSTLDALESLDNYQKVVLWPNADAGGEDVAKGIRIFREKHDGKNFRFHKNFSPEDFVRVLANCSCAVGNSSSFLREGDFLGVPAVSVGDRQNKREHGKNIIFCEYDSKIIKTAIQDQISSGPFENSSLFGYGDAGKKIARQIPDLNHSLLKPLTY